MHYRSDFAGLVVLLTLTPVLAQPPEEIPLEKLPPTREAMIGWIKGQAHETASVCTVSLNDGSVLRGELRTLGNGPNVSLQTRLSAQPLEVPLDQIAKLHFRDLKRLSLLPPAKVQLRDGSWMLGVDNLSLDERSLRFSTPYADGLEVPRGVVSDIEFVTVRQAPQMPERRNIVHFQEPVAAVRPEPAPGNVGRLWLQNGDVLSGRAVSASADFVTYQLQLGPEIRVPLGEVTRMSLPPETWTPPATPADNVSACVTLITGEVWHGTVEELDAKELQLGWYGGKKVALPRGLLHSLSEFERGISGVRQWATSATASSEYGNPNWGAVQATGPPNTMRAGDAVTAWAPRAQDGGAEWLELKYTTPVHATRVRVRETHNPGAVVRVEAIDAAGEVLTLWEGRDPTTQAPGWLDVRCPPTKALVQTIKVHLDTTLVPDWQEIDAVELVGTP